MTCCTFVYSVINLIKNKQQVLPHTVFVSFVNKLVGSFCLFLNIIQ